MSKSVKTLQALVKLDYDAIEAYEEAIERLDDAVAKTKLMEFCNDHRRHTENIGNILRNLGEEVPDGPDVKRFLTEGKVVIADLGGDKAILKAMVMNETVTNKAYEEACSSDDLDATMQQTLEQNLADEARHKQWIEARIEVL